MVISVETRASSRIQKWIITTNHIHGYRVIVDRINKAPLLFKERGWGEGRFLYSRTINVYIDYIIELPSYHLY